MNWSAVDQTPLLRLVHGNGSAPIALAWKPTQQRFDVEHGLRRPMMAQGNVTTDHGKIRRWAEERGGIPATVKATKAHDEPGVLRLDFEPRDKALEPIEWNAFFEKFEREGLAFLHQDHTQDGKVSRFHKFVERS
jgi:hypothetical protein